MSILVGMGLVDEVWLGVWYFNCILHFAFDSIRSVCFVFTALRETHSLIEIEKSFRQSFWSLTGSVFSLSCGFGRLVVGLDCGVFLFQKY